MAKIPSIVPVSNLRQDAARVLKEVRGSNEPVFISQRGRATAVLMSIDAYRHSETRRELLLLLAQGGKEIASGVGHELDGILVEADVLLAEKWACSSSSVFLSNADRAINPCSPRN